MTFVVEVTVGIAFPIFAVLAMLTTVIGLVAVSLKAAYWGVKLYKELKEK